MKKRVYSIDYGAGNIASVFSALSHIGVGAHSMSYYSDDLCEADAIILPGVGDGSFMIEQLNKRGFTKPLQKLAQERMPILGICVGAQVLLSLTQEGDKDCLDVISGECKSFSQTFYQNNITGLKNPHMGWNDVKLSSMYKNHPLFNTIDGETAFYFIHSYYLDCMHTHNVFAVTEYGIPFASIIVHNSVFGTQFHPEKSGKQGLQLIFNFFKHIAKVI